MGQTSFGDFGPTALADGFQVLPGLPDRLAVLRNAFFVPGHDCLFDENGARIAESGLLRGPLETFALSTPERIEVPRKFESCTEPVVYFGMVGVRHWGHFLTEGISRLWYSRTLDSAGPARWFYHGRNLRDRGRTTILEQAGVDIGRLESPTQALLLQEVAIPVPTMMIRNRIYSAHADLPVAAGRAIAAGPPSPSEQPVYLSRSRLPSGHRRIEGELALERILTAARVRVVYPEQMSVEEQIGMVDTHRTFIGMVGAAFHSLLFARPGTSLATVVFTGPKVNTNYLMIDAIKGIDARYVPCLTPDFSSGSVAETRQPQLLDLEQALQGLRDARIL